MSYHEAEIVLILEVEGDLDLIELETTLALLSTPHFRVRRVDCIDTRPLTNFEMDYECPACGTHWSQQWSAIVNDECPACGLSDVQPCHVSD